MKLKKTWRRVNREIEKAQREAALLAAEKAKLSEEKNRIDSEYERLGKLDDKSLFVELIMAVRGLHTQIQNIQTKEAELEMTISELDDRVDALEMQISRYSDD